MTNNKDEYENISRRSSRPSESIYLNPLYPHHDEVPLLDNSIDDDGDEQSPYEEVAANISNKDDPAMLYLTIRSIFIGILLTIGMAFTYQFFSFRTSPVDVNIGIVILLAFIIGEFLEKILPEKLFSIPLNPGPFSVKELALITIMATAGSYTTYAVESLTIQRIYYHYYLSHVTAILYIIFMHLIAFSIAGILNRYLVWPGPMIWPKTLMSCALIRTLDAEDETAKIESRWTMKRSTFFWLIVLGQFIYYWFPGYIFPLLSFFSFICMIAPNRIILSQVTGAYGLGIGAIEFDWNSLVAYLDSPILVPFWAHVNMFFGFIVVIWITTPCFYYLNIWNAQKMPIISNRLFDINGYYYNTTKILDNNLRLNETAYESYGPVLMSSGYAVSFIYVFAAIPALIIHAILYHGTSIVEQFSSSISDKKNDIHAKLMSQYPQVPDWCYYILLAITLILGMVYFHLTGIMPGYILLFSVILDFILILPIGIITAMTNMMMSTSILSDLMSGLILPGNPIGYLGFRTYTYSCQFQVINFLINFKIAHYMKIPPRTTFLMLITCPIITSIVSYMTALYLLDSVPNICTSQNLAWRCLNAENSYTLSVIWGTIGSDQILGPNSQYSPLLWGFLLGAIVPVISWGLWKKFPNIHWLELINFPIIFMASNLIPPAPAAEYPTWFLTGFIFNFILYRYAHNWWEKYAYIFSAAMSCGVVICGLVIFFALQYNDIQFPQWWGLGGPTGDGCPLDNANFSGVTPTFSDL